MYQPLTQDSSLATFTKILTKQDRVVDPGQMSALEIYNYYRAYLLFPGTVFYDDYFRTNLKLLDCCLTDNLNRLDDLEKAQISIEVYGNWYRTQKDGNVYVLRACKNKTLLTIKRIGFENGQSLTLSGYQFK